MKKKLCEWWNNRKKTVLTVGITLLGLLVFWCCYYTAYQHIKGENSLITRLNLLFGSSGEEIQVKEEGRKENTVIFLVGGLDQFQNMDAIMLAALDKQSKSIRLLSVPKDSLSKTERNEMQISKAYGENGIKGLKKELKNLTGLPIDRYVLVKYEGFEKLIDHVGGVALTVPQQMDYEDSVQNLSIHLAAGEQTLNGKDALNFVRFCSYEDGDLGRIRAQQSLFKSFAKKVIEQKGTAKELAKLGAETIETDLSAEELLWLSSMALKRDAQEDIAVEILPGLTARFLENTYYIVNKTATLGLINAKFNPYNEKISELQVSEIGQNLFTDWRAGNKASNQGYTPGRDEEGLKDPTRFCEYYYEYAEDVVEDSLFADAMNTPDKSIKENNKSASESTPKPSPTPTPTPNVPIIYPVPEVKDHYIILDPDQNPEDFGIDPGQVEYWTPAPSPTPQPTAKPEETEEEKEAPSEVETVEKELEANSPIE